MSTQGALRERAALLEELRQIVQAMRNLAFSEMQRLSRVIAAQAQAREELARALAQAGAGGAPASAACWIVIGTERGFCGAFNERIALAARELLAQDPAPRLLVAGRRLQDLLDPLPGVQRLPGCAALDEADACLDAWLETLAAAAPDAGATWVLHAAESGPVRRPLRAPLPVEGGAAPLRYLAEPALRTALLRQSLRLELESSLLASLLQENRWRLGQMQRAQDHLDELSTQLRRRYAARRQEAITDEQETLLSALQAAPLPSGFPSAA